VSFALARAHAKGVTHGALKPENVLQDRRGNALVADFGMGRLVALPQGSVRVVVDLGDAAYRSPEASATAPAEPPQDAYALGAILYEMLAGKVPGREAPVPSRCRAGCPPGLDDLVESLLDDSAARRPPLARVAARLEALAGSQPLFSL
jgi:serine/threonine protein kinase